MPQKRKRLVEETFSDISSVRGSSPNAKLQGLITPINKGRTCEYLDGQMKQVIFVSSSCLVTLRGTSIKVHK